jgi:hypothetical protein
VLLGQLEYLAKDLEEQSCRDSSLWSIALMISVAQSLSFTGGNTPNCSTTVSIGECSEMVIYVKESPTDSKLNWVLTETKIPEGAKQQHHDEWESPSQWHTIHRSKP